MACDATWSGAVSVLLRRVARRLLVLAGLVIAGWLLGCAAQSAAHAAEVPPVPSHVIAETPVLGQAVETAAGAKPVDKVMRSVAEKAPLEQKASLAQKLTPPLVPPPPEVAPEPEPEPEPAGNVRKLRTPVADAAPAPPAQRRITKPVHAAPDAGGRVAHRVVRDDPAPMRAPDRPDDRSAVGVLVAPGVTAGFPDVRAWAPAPPRAVIPRALGAVPPAVRTAADEPSFAPD